MEIDVKTTKPFVQGPAAWGARSRQERNLMRLCLDATPSLISCVDPHERYLYNNKAYEKLFNCPACRLKGLRVRDLVGTRTYGRIAGNIKMALSGRRQEFETVLEGVRGKEIHVTASLVPRVLENHRVEGFVATITVLDPLERRPDRWRCSRKGETIGRVAGDIAHDLNNLLTAMGGNVDLALACSPEDVELRTNLAELKRSIRRSASLTRKLLTCSRGGASFTPPPPPPRRHRRRNGP